MNKKLTESVSWSLQHKDTSDKLKKYAIDKSDTSHSLHSSSLNDKLLLLTNGEDTTDIPLIPYAVSVETETDDYVVLDMRPFTSGTGKVHNKSDASIMIANGVLESLWHSESYTEVQKIMNYAGRLYAAILSKQLTTSLRLDGKDAVLIRVVVAIKYLHLFTDSIDKDRLVNSVATMLMVDYDIVNDIVSKMKDTELLTWDQVAETLRDLSENVKLSKVKAAVFVELFSKVFFCTNSSMKLISAIDHPPIWGSIVFAALDDKRYKRTLLSGMLSTEPSMFREHRDDYLKTMKSLMKPFMYF